MEEYRVLVESVEKVTHDVLRIVTTKPLGYTFKPGQATEVSINKSEWKDERRPFTFTCLPADNYFEFTIKTYPEHEGVTNQLIKLKKQDELLLHDVFGAITYENEGVFIAGGAGVTPFVSIFRDLNQNGKIGNNKLIFANKTRADIIYEQEFKQMLGDAFINILSDEDAEGYEHGRISESFLQKYIIGGDNQYYVCGPPPMMEAVLKYLSNLGVGEGAITVEI